MYACMYVCMHICMYVLLDYCFFRAKVIKDIAKVSWCGNILCLILITCENPPKKFNDFFNVMGIFDWPMENNKSSVGQSQNRYVGFSWIFHFNGHEFSSSSILRRGPKIRWNGILIRTLAASTYIHGTINSFWSFSF